MKNRRRFILNMAVSAAELASAVPVRPPADAKSAARLLEGSGGYATTGGPAAAGGCDEFPRHEHSGRRVVRLDLSTGYEGNTRLAELRVFC